VTSPFVRSYTDRLSYAAGEPVSLFVTAEAPREASVRLVHLTKALGEGGTPPADAVELPWDAAGTYLTTEQDTCIGSFASLTLAAPPAPLSDWSVGAWVWCPAPGVTPRQTIVSTVDAVTSAGTSLALVDGRPALVDGVGGPVLLTVDEPLRPAAWFLVVATVTGGVGTLQVLPADPMYGDAATASGPVDRVLDLSVGLTVAGAGSRGVVVDGSIARGLSQETFNGKIEAPFVSTATPSGTVAGELLAACQDGLVVRADLSPLPGQAAPDLVVLPAGAGSGLLVNGPTRAMIGHSWTGRVDAFVDAPEQYAAVHFHDTDIVDAGWTPLLTAALPADLPSAVYGLEIRTGAAVDTVPLFVTPAPGAAREKVAFLVPTFSYLAYANELLFDGDVDFAATKEGELQLNASDEARIGGGDYGRSLYDTHRDGSGVTLSTAGRPVLNLRHDDANWLNGGGRGLSGDMYLVEWLDRQGIGYDVITDLELHQQGADALSPYKVVLTGAHPEYDSDEMMDAFLAYRDGGGKLMYLGGNGFYWRTAVASEQPCVVEIRRGYAGIRAWESHPGETWLHSTSTRGGLWRHNGRPPQELCGIGFCAQGWGPGRPYTRHPASKDPAVAWIFDGVDEEQIGDYGWVLGGAAGDELDRVDFRLGTPSGTYVLASSGGHSNHYQRVIEEIPMNVEGYGGGAQDPEVKADMVYFTTPAGGAVFSVGSIGWSGALLVNGGDNGVSRITANVVARFSEG
jgi:N,N-dimethylformamidase